MTIKSKSPVLLIFIQNRRKRRRHHWRRRRSLSSMKYHPKLKKWQLFHRDQAESLMLLKDRPKFQISFVKTQAKKTATQTYTHFKYSIQAQLYRILFWTYKRFNETYILETSSAKRRHLFSSQIAC